MTSRSARPLFPGGTCPCCGFEMTNAAHRKRLARSAQPTHDATIDYIYPRAYGGTNKPDNLRVYCRLCVQSRASVDYCVGTLACIRTVIGRKRPTVGVVAKTWLAWKTTRRGPA
jgi:hypothetical protein